MAAAGIPTASSRTFTDLAPALAWVEGHAEPLVVKASGLAAGKGAVVCATRAEASATVRAMLGDGRFGDAGRTVVIESFLEGEEVSILALTNGTDVTLFPAAQDHKRLSDGDEGPNTGGMGAYAPVSIASPELLERTRKEVLLPCLAELKRRGAPFSGVLYAGLMVDAAGTPWVVEFNCRLGDPEAEVVLPLAGGVTAAFEAIARGDTPPELQVPEGVFAVTTVLASEGYPDAPRKGQPIELPAKAPEGVLIFHAGTIRDDQGVLRVSGGRVFAVTGLGQSFAEAQERSRAGAAAIQFEGKVYRTDIGWRETARTSGV
jgi:phosphoribosylamine--glycine ligase